MEKLNHFKKAFYTKQTEHFLYNFLHLYKQSGSIAHFTINGFYVYTSMHSKKKKLALLKQFSFATMLQKLSLVEDIEKGVR